jgi:exportin-T
MVVCLEEELLPYIPQASEGLLKGSDVRSIQEYVPLIVQIIAKFKVSQYLNCITP